MHKVVYPLTLVLLCLSEPIALRACSTILQPVSGIQGTSDMAQGLLDIVSQIGRGFEKIYDEQVPTMQEARGLLGMSAPQPTVYNNPGNVERNQDWAGMVSGGYGSNDRFAIFDSPQMGLRALMRDAQTKIKNEKGDLRKMISRYAPRSENPTERYYNYVRSKVGKDKVTMKDLPNIVKGIIEFENKPGSALSNMYLKPEIFSEALNLSKKSMPKGTSLTKARQMVRKK